ncbi:MAG: MBL fold metallo-hydrolase, partial [Candidatus Bathyarchaeota archaeon]
TLHEGDVIHTGKTSLRVLHTPGHSKGSITLSGHDVAFTGDTLFAGSIGRYDLPNASYKEIMHSIKRLAKLPEHVKVYSGHGPTSTIGREKSSNPFLQMSL